VFAVAITLLVLDIKTPKAADLAAAHTGLAGALLAQWPAYLSYVLSLSPACGPTITECSGTSRWWTTRFCR